MAYDARLLADTEAVEHTVQDVLGVDGADDQAKLLKGATDFGRQQLMTKACIEQVAPAPGARAGQLQA